MYFECYKCILFKTNKKSNIISHLLKKKNCDHYNIFDTIDLSQNEILERSLIPKYKIIEQKKFTCNLCNKNFKSNRTLNIHINKNCKLKNCDGESEDNIYSNIETNIETNIEINTENNTQKNSERNTEKNIKINIENKTIIINNNFQNSTFNINIIDFNDEYSIDHISQKDKILILFCHFRYTTLLREILNNYINLNVFIDESSEESYVYNNLKKNFEKMDKNKIIEKTIDKLHKNLIEINNEIENDKNFYLNRNFININKKEIDDKFNKYFKESEKNKENINGEFINLYKNKNEETKINYKNFKKRIENGF
jgi:hypothetical protein